MLEQMKRIARQTGEAGSPARIMFGIVTEASPLRVRVDNRFNLTAPALIALREGHTHLCPAEGESQSITDEGTHAAYEVGDKVALLRDHGGQTFLVLGRV